MCTVPCLQSGSRKIFTTPWLIPRIPEYLVYTFPSYLLHRMDLCLRVHDDIAHEMSSSGYRVASHQAPLKGNHAPKFVSEIGTAA